MEKYSIQQNIIYLYQLTHLVYPLTESSSVCTSDLEEFNNYTVSIRANNGAGEGKAAVITVITLEAGL